MQTELRAIQQYVNTTTIYVTHDQEEAFTLSDRIMVMNRGLIEQNGTPVEIYDRPRSEFVAEFIGVTNFFDGKVLSKDQEGVMLEVKGVSVHVADNPLLVKGAKVRLAVRPDRIALRQKTESGTGQLTGTVTSTSFSGAFMRVVVDLGGESLTAHMRTEIANSFPPGSTLSVEVDPSDWLVLPLPSSDTRMKK
jgi:ABC-type Fe3+/spermidine/putrescine transport system ATPase subunit